MSSKSRNKPSSGGDSSRSSKPMRAQAPDAAKAEEHHLLDLPDELIDAPEGTSKLRFALLVGLVVLLLLIFAIPQSSIMGLTGGSKRDDPIAIQWDRLNGEREVIHFMDLRNELRDLDQAQGFANSVLAQLGIVEKVTMRDAARVHVLAKMAEDSGIRVPDRQLGEFLQNLITQSFGGDKEAYKRTIESIALQGTKVEPVVRRCLLAHRFLSLVGYAGAVATPSGVEAAWNFDHTEVAFEYVRVGTDEFLDAARADLPDDAGLEAWFEKQSEPAKAAYFTPERRTSDVAVFRDLETTPASGLLAAYPPAEGTVPEEQADDYYQRVYYRRFVKPAAEPSGDEAEDSLPPTPNYSSFDEVKDRCLGEAPVYFAMIDWLADLREREQAGTEVDFPAEVASMGLELIHLESATREDLADIPDLSDPAMANTLFSATPDDYSFALSWNDKVIGFAHTVERVEPTLPEFAEIRDRVAEDWVKPKAQELATAHLTAVWRKFETYDPELDPRNPYAFFFANQIHRRAEDDAFRAAVAEAGLEVLTRDFVDRSARKDPAENADDPDRTYLWGRNFLLSFLEVGEVAEPAANTTGDTIYLVRVSGNRFVQIANMSPKDYDNYQTRARTEFRREYLAGMGLDELERTVGLVTVMDNLYGDEPEEQGSSDSSGS